MAPHKIGRSHSSKLGNFHLLPCLFGCFPNKLMQIFQAPLIKLTKYIHSRTSHSFLTKINCCYLSSATRSFSTKWKFLISYPHQQHGYLQQTETKEWASEGFPWAPAQSNRWYSLEVVGPIYRHDMKLQTWSLF